MEMAPPSPPGTPRIANMGGGTHDVQKKRGEHYLTTHHGRFGFPPPTLSLSDVANQIETASLVVKDCYAVAAAAQENDNGKNEEGRDGSSKNKATPSGPYTNLSSKLLVVSEVLDLIHDRLRNELFIPPMTTPGSIVRDGENGPSSTTNKHPTPLTIEEDPSVDNVLLGGRAHPSIRLSSYHKKYHGALTSSPVVPTTDDERIDLYKTLPLRRTTGNCVRKKKKKKKKNGRNVWAVQGDGYIFRDHEGIFQLHEALKYDNNNVADDEGSIMHKPNHGMVQQGCSTDLLSQQYGACVSIASKWINHLSVGTTSCHEIPTEMSSESKTDTTWYK